MSKKIVDGISKKTTRKFYGRDFDAMRGDLARYASIYFADQIKDFSDASVGGLLLDMASSVGDTMSFYLDHQFGELNIDTAVETKNIEKLLITAGVKMRASAPAIVYVSFYIEVPVEKDINDNYVPNEDYLPTIQAGTQLKSNSGVIFELVDDLDFSKQINDEWIADFVVGDLDADGIPTTMIMKYVGLCVSGETTVKTIPVSGFEQFKQITIPQQDINEIVSVVDSSGNEYYEVEYLSQDVVFKEVQNKDYDYDVVSANLEIMPAPYRFTRELSRVSGHTTLTFGSGNASSLDNDFIPDPSEFSMPLYGKSNFAKISIDPSNMLSTSTLGMAPHNTTLFVKCRYGGGLSHNVRAKNIKTIEKLFIEYNRNSNASANLIIKTSLNVLNENEAVGGEDKPTLNQMRYEYKGHMNSQNRIVTKADLLSRVYTMPSNFGRVFRAGITKNSANPLATQLFIISRNKSKKLTHSSDTLKKNLETYLNQFRLISDAVDIMDAFVINVGVEYEIITDGITHKNIVVQQINNNIKAYFDIKKWQIDQPINKSDIHNIILNSAGVISLLDVKIVNKFGGNYSQASFDVDANTKNGFIVGPVGSIFEMLNPTDDIIGYVK